MECTGKFESITRDWLSGKWLITFSTNENITGSIDKIKDKILRLVVKQYREKRSLDSNAYAWVLMQKIAEAVQSDKWSVYLEMLAKYSRAFTHVIVKPDVVPRFEAEWRTVRNLGEITVNGQTGIQLQLYFGSSTFDTKEMSVFIDGLIEECRQLEIETLPPNEIERMKREWGVEV